MPNSRAVLFQEDIILSKLKNCIYFHMEKKCSSASLLLGPLYIISRDIKEQMKAKSKSVQLLF